MTSGTCSALGASPASTNPEHCDVRTVLDFLQSMSDKGSVASTLKVYVPPSLRAIRVGLMDGWVKIHCCLDL